MKFKCWSGAPMSTLVIIFQQASPSCNPCASHGHRAPSTKSSAAALDFPASLLVISASMGSQCLRCGKTTSQSPGTSAACMQQCIMCCPPNQMAPIVVNLTPITRSSNVQKAMISCTHSKNNQALSILSYIHPSQGSRQECVALQSSWLHLYLNGPVLNSVSLSCISWKEHR